MILAFHLGRLIARYVRSGSLSLWGIFGLLKGSAIVFKQSRAPVSIYNGFFVGRVHRYVALLSVGSNQAKIDLRFERAITITVLVMDALLFLLWNGSVSLLLLLVLDE